MITQKCAYTDPGKDTYEVLLDQYEEGMDSATIDRVFEELKEGLLPLLRRNPAQRRNRTALLSTGFYDIPTQMKVQDAAFELHRLFS